MTRFDIMTYLLDQRKLFKLVCGAGNEDAEEVRRLVFVYALAGAKCFDVSANIYVVKSALDSIGEATHYAKKLKRRIETRPFVNVSIGMHGDPHVRKAILTENCVRCNACIVECPTDAITKDLKVVEEKCIGCGNCEAVCDWDAVEFYHKNKDLKNLLRECKIAGTEQLELHAAVPDSESVFEEWTMINEIVNDNYVSMCLDRLHLSDSRLKRRIVMAKSVSKERLVIQADGVPMSGANDDFNTTLQAVAIADIVMKSNLGVRVLLSGGTNSLTARLATMCGVSYNGIAIGTFARNSVKGLIREKDFMQDDGRIAEAVKIADKLVMDSIGDVLW